MLTNKGLNIVVNSKQVQSTQVTLYHYLIIFLSISFCPFDSKPFYKFAPN